MNELSIDEILKYSEKINQLYSIINLLKNEITDISYDINMYINNTKPIYYTDGKYKYKLSRIDLQTKSVIGSIVGDGSVWEAYIKNVKFIEDNNDE